MSEEANVKHVLRRAGVAMFQQKLLDPIVAELSIGERPQLAAKTSWVACDGHRIYGALSSPYLLLTDRRLCVIREVAPWDKDRSTPRSLVEVISLLVEEMAGVSEFDPQSRTSSFSIAMHSGDSYELGRPAHAVTSAVWPFRASPRRFRTLYDALRRKAAPQS